MSLLCRINKSAKPNNIISHFTRHYFHNHSSLLSNHIILTPQLIPFNNNYVFNFTQSQVINQRPDVISSTTVRFFAAPVQFLNNKKKDDEKQLNRPRLNDEIKVDFVRLVTDEGHSVVSRREALQRAKELDVDLVEVDRHSKPPVCKLMDFKREQYKKQVKEKEKAKIKSAGSLKTGACKEVRFSTKAELKDLKTKADLVRRLMERGYRVKCMALAVEDQDLTGLLSKVAELIEDVAYVESGPKFERRQGFLIVRHIKFGPNKKGGGVEASKLKISSGMQKETASSSESTIDSEEQYGEESGMDNDNEDSGMGSENEKEGPLQGQEGTSMSKSSVPNFVSANVSPPSQGLENRYARKVPKNAPPARDPMRSSNNGCHPQSHSSFRPSGSLRQGGNEGLPSRNFPPRQNDIPQPRGETPNGTRPYDRNFQPQAGRPTPPSFAGNNRPQSSGFGVFSGAKAESGVQVDQQTNGSAPNVTRNFTVPGNVNPPRSRSEDSAVSAGKKWGIFSGGSSNSGSGRND